MEVEKGIHCLTLVLVDMFAFAVLLSVLNTCNKRMSTLEFVTTIDYAG